MEQNQEGPMSKISPGGDMDMGESFGWVRNFGWENFLLGGGFHSDFLQS